MLVHHNTSRIQENNEICYRMRSIFEWGFLCRLKQMHIISKEEIYNVGLPSTMNRDYDYEFANVMVNAIITISDMAELYADGITFQIMEDKDPEKIYHCIRDYLDICANALNERNIGEEVAKSNEHVINFIKDVQKLEDLGNVLYPMFAFEKKAHTKVIGFGRTRRLNSLRQSRMTENALSEEEKRIQQKFKLDFRKELIPHVRDSTSVWFRRR